MERRTGYKFGVWVVAAIWCALAGASEASADCPEAREHRIHGALELAEDRARSCVDAYPLDADNLAELARVLAAQGEYERALSTAEEAVRLSPDDPSLTLLVARIHAWRGELKPALDEMKRFPAAGLTDRSATLFRARLSLWANEYEDAVDWFSRFLQGEPTRVEALYGRGLALARVGNKQAALTDLGRACRLGGTRTKACEAEARLREEVDPPLVDSVYAHGEFSTVADLGEGWSVFGSMTLQPVRDVFITPAAEVRTRPFPDGHDTDVMMMLDATVPVTGPLQLRMGADYAPDSTFFPVWGADVAAHLLFGPYDAGLRYWHIQFDDAGVEVVNPSLVAYFGASLIDARYYLAIEPDRLSHAALARYGVQVGQMMLYAGAGAGNRSDFVELRDVDVERHWLVLGKANWEFIERNKLSLGALHRRDVAGDADYVQTQFLLGYERSFGP